MCKALVANLGVQMHDQGLNPFVGGRAGGERWRESCRTVFPKCLKGRQGNTLSSWLSPTLHLPILVVSLTPAFICVGCWDASVCCLASLCFSIAMIKIRFCVQ